MAHKKDKDFKRVEQMLKSYPDLLFRIEQYKKDIDRLESIEFPDKIHMSPSVIIPSQGGYFEHDAYVGIDAQIAKIKFQLKGMILEAEKIKAALEIIQSDSYARIIDLKYFKNMNYDLIADELKCDPRTVIRHKDRLIQRLKNMLL